MCSAFAVLLGGIWTRHANYNSIIEKKEMRIIEKKEMGSGVVELSAVVTLNILNAWWC